MQDFAVGQDSYLFAVGVQGMASVPAIVHEKRSAAAPS